MNLSHFEKKLLALAVILQNSTLFQVNVFNGFMEAYDGPREPVDLIVMCAVAYYIPDKKAMVHQALNWLKSGGHFIMIHWPHDTPIQKGQDTIRKCQE